MSEPIAVTNTSEVMVFAQGAVLKLYREGWPKAAVNREARAARVAHAAGLPTPAVHEVVERGGRHGVVFERCDGPTLLQTLIRNPNRANECAGMLAKLHVKIHQCSPGGLAPRAQRLADAVTRAALLTAQQKSRIVEIIRTLPAGSTLCHGDFYPDQVIATEQGLQIIDWFDAGAGDAVSDIAKTLLVIQHAVLPEPGGGGELASIRVPFAKHYLSQYVQLRPIDLGSLPDWTLAVAAARMATRLSKAEYSTMAKIVAGLLAELDQGSGQAGGK